MVAGFNDRRPQQAVPKVSLRSKAALEEHMRTHHGQSPDVWSHSELRENHQSIHGDQFAVVHVPHTHEHALYVNPPDGA